VIAFGVLVLFDKWLCPERGEAILMESLGVNVKRDRSRLLEASNFYLDSQGVPTPPLPPPTSDLPAHIDLLNRAMAEGVPEHRYAILLVAITRVARIGLEVDRVIITARQKISPEIHVLVQPEIHAAVQAIAAVLEIAHELPTHIAVSADTTPSASRTRARSALETFNARIIQVRPVYIGEVSSAEIENFASFTDSLAALTGHIERLLDEPPPATVPSKKAVPPLLNAPDPSISRYSLKVGACAVEGTQIGYPPAASCAGRRRVWWRRWRGRATPAPWRCRPHARARSWPQWRAANGRRGRSLRR
jgi:hypothetical protein